ncbi:uncharacterized protein YhfF [Janthinobacterium sp. CG_23.3]|uniref:hypothetical protein n=1 Tax=Janthinobacterium sp. CG_23.3 TaxID=3349634 RepID=UPI0038D44966
MRCLINATKVYNIQFGHIPEEVWRGETFSSAQEFQECHVRCMPDQALSDDVQFTTLHFELREVLAEAAKRAG